MVKSYSRGHEIYFDGHTWRYCDTDQPINEEERPCKRCGKMPTADGHDACLGYIQGAVSACCGHGVHDPYVVKATDGGGTMTTRLSFTIPIPPITKKNSQQIAINRKTGRPFVTPSKKYKEYERAAMGYIAPSVQVETPVNVKCLFYMPTRRRVDLTNLLEAIDDVMVKAGLLPDDDYTVIQSHDGSRVLYDKENPRTEIEITKAE